MRGTLNASKKSKRKNATDDGRKLTVDEKVNKEYTKMSKEHSKMMKKLIK
ncbi:MAG: hypothetical protein K0A90_03700 [Methanosarcinaceae archaeon]|nr:hypothetical protein [Methanosarcinaceae archaeon]